MPMFKANINALEKSGLRDKVIVMVGGAPVTQEYADVVGADGYAADASTAVRLAKELIEHRRSAVGRREPKLADRMRGFAAAASVEVTPKHAERLSELGRLLPAGYPDLHHRPARRRYRRPGARRGRRSAAAGHDAGAAHRRPGHRRRPMTSWTVLLGRLVAEAAVDDVLVVAGGRSRPAGAFPSSMEVLESGLLERHGIRRVGVAGHPEGSPDIPADAERGRDRARRTPSPTGSPLELRIVTQFALAARALRGLGAARSASAATGCR